MEEMLKMIDTYYNTSPFIVPDKGYTINALNTYTLIDIELEPRHSLEEVTLGLVKEIDVSRYPTEKVPTGSSLYMGMYMVKPDFDIEVKNYYMDNPILMCIKLEKATKLEFNPTHKIYYPIIKYVNCHFSTGTRQALSAFTDYFIHENCEWSTS